MDRPTMVTAHYFLNVATTWEHIFSFKRSSFLVFSYKCVRPHWSCYAEWYAALICAINICVWAKCALPDYLHDEFYSKEAACCVVLFPPPAAQTCLWWPAGVKRCKTINGITIYLSVCLNSGAAHATVLVLKCSSSCSFSSCPHHRPGFVATCFLEQHKATQGQREGKDRVEIKFDTWAFFSTMKRRVLRWLISVFLSTPAREEFFLPPSLND